MRGDRSPEAQLDAVLAIETRRAQRHPFLGRVAGEIILGQVRPIDRRRVVAAQHDDAAVVVLAPQHLGRGKAGGSAADDDDLSRRVGRGLAARLRLRVRFSRTKTLPSRCSTAQQATGLSAGARSASPVRRSKQA